MSTSVTGLSWLAVWNRSLTAEAAAKRDDNDDYGEGSSADRERDESGVLCALSFAAVRTETAQEQDILARRVGLAQGLVDFARSFSVDGKTESMRIVHSANQRLVFLKPEPHEDYWIVAAFETAGAKTTAPAHSRDSSAASTSTVAGSTSKAAGKKPAVTKPGDQAYLDLLWEAYARFRIVNGPLSHVFDGAGRKGLQASLHAYFTKWATGSLEVPSFGLPRSQLHGTLGRNITALVHEAEVQGRAIVIHRSGIISLPSSAPDAPCYSDAYTIASLLTDFLGPAEPQEPAVQLTPGSPRKPRSAKKTAASSERKSSASWKNLGLGGLGSYLVPPVPTLRAAFSNGKGIKTTPQKSAEAGGGKERSVSAGSWMSMGGFGLPWGGAEAMPKATADKAHDSLPAANEDTVKQESASSPAVMPDDLAVVTEPSAGVRAKTPDIDSEALEAAIADEIPSVPQDTELSPAAKRQIASETVQDLKKESRVLWVKLNDSEEGWREVVFLTHGDLAIALVSSSPRPEVKGADAPLECSSDLFVKASSVLAALTRMLIVPLTPSVQSSEPDYLEPATTYYCCPASLSAQERTVTLRDTASSSSATLQARMNTARNALSDIAAFSALNTLSLFIRTSALTWLVSHPSEDKLGRDVLVLPKSVGKEGSLIDADNEYRRLRASAT